MQRSLVILFTATLVFACQEPSPELAPSIEQLPTETPSTLPADPRAPQTTPDNTPRTPVEIGTEPHHGALGPGTGAQIAPAPETGPFVRPRRRMNIEQLGAAIAEATGGVIWAIGTAGSEVDQLENLAATLGRPDYLQSVHEDLSAGPVFQKFLGDAARFVCTKLVEKELTQEPAERVLMVDVTPEDTAQSAPDAVDANLRLLVLRYHGRKPLENDAALSQWRWLFESATHVTQEPAQAWRAVCVSLITHPDFYSY